MAVTTQKTASWGISTPMGQTNVTGVITDWEDSTEPTLQPEQNEMGSVINQTMNDIHFTCSMTLQVKASEAKPKAGQAIVIGGKTWYCTSSRVTESNNAYRKIAVSAERYALCTAVEAASGISSTAT